MTALDPAPILRSRRGALELLDDLREQVAEFLDHPSADRLRTMTNGAQQFLRFEADEVLPELADADFPVERVTALAQGHDALSARLNRISWAVPGTSEVQNEAHHLRHELLAQVGPLQRPAPAPGLADQRHLSH